MLRYNGIASVSLRLDLKDFGDLFAIPKFKKSPRYFASRMLFALPLIERTTTYRPDLNPDTLNLVDVALDAILYSEISLPLTSTILTKALPSAISLINVTSSPVSRAKLL